MPTNLNSPFVVFFLSRIIIITISPYGKLLIEHEDTRRFSNAKRNANFTRKHNSICEKCQNLVQSNTGHLFPCFSPGFVGLKKTSSLKENYRRIALWTGMWKRLFRQPLPHLSLLLQQNLDSNRAWALSHLWTCWQAWLSKPAAYDLQGHITS